MTVEFSRLIPVDRVPDLGTREKLEANPEERAALAARFELVSIESFAGKMELTPWRRGGVRVTGKLEADFTQTCVVTLEAFPAHVTVELERFFLGKTNAGATQVRDVESLEGDEPDLIVDNAIDLGELAAEELGLALDMYPRKPGAEFASGPEPEEAPEKTRQPFASLA
ncbi:MAG: DUF177 domain-containing protein, partial [Aestuariivirgaceae bacterium]|nr:DUF177 domain-containing protein [Aestuariivirgaceae bacterium]